MRRIITSVFVAVLVLSGCKADNRSTQIDKTDNRQVVEEVKVKKREIIYQTHETIDYGIFKLPEGFEEIDSGSPCACSYVDVSDFKYSGQVILANGGYQPEYPDFDSLRDYARSKLIYIYSESLSVSDPEIIQEDVVIDNVEGYSTVLINDDGYQVEVYHIPALFFDGTVEGYFEIVFFYNIKKYPTFSRDFFDFYTLREDIKEPQCTSL